MQHNPGSTNLTSPSDQPPVFDETTDHDMERCTRNTRELQSQLAVVLPARWPLSCPQLPCLGHTPPSPDRPEPSRIRVPARTGSTIVASKGCAVTLPGCFGFQWKPRRGRRRRSDTGPVLWPHHALAPQEYRFGVETESRAQPFFHHCGPVGTSCCLSTRRRTGNEMQGEDGGCCHLCHDDIPRKVAPGSCRGTSHKQR